MYYKEYKKCGTGLSTEGLVTLIWDDKNRNKKNSLSQFLQLKLLKHCCTPTKQNRCNSLTSFVYLVSLRDPDSCFCSQILQSGAYLPL